MADATTDHVAMDNLDAFIREAIKIIRYSKQARSDERTIHDILCK